MSTKIATTGSMVSLVALGGWTWDGVRPVDDMAVPEGTEQVSVGERHVVVFDDIARAIRAHLEHGRYHHASGTTPGVIGRVTIEVEESTLSEVIRCRGASVCSADTRGGFRFGVAAPSVVPGTMPEPDPQLTHRGSWHIRDIPHRGLLCMGEAAWFRNRVPDEPGQPASDTAQEQQFRVSRDDLSSASLKTLQQIDAIRDAGTWVGRLLIVGTIHNLVVTSSRSVVVAVPSAVSLKQNVLAMNGVSKVFVCEAVKSVELRMIAARGARPHEPWETRVEERYFGELRRQLNSACHGA